ncbi:ThiF family adenylyltransferase [Planctomycetales bacterium ZRK34]|nr:ThiF family adenylyltransferase [Planctomycetales bacterium ZRK34]
MDRYTLAIQQAHLDELRSLVLTVNGHEHVAYLLCGQADVPSDPWTGSRTRRLLSFEVMALADEDLVSSSDAHVRCRTRSFARVLKRARDENLAVAVVHSHPEGIDCFSKVDDGGEPFLVEMAQNRNGTGCPIASVVLTRSGNVFGRVWTEPQHSSPISMVSAVGDQLRLHYEERENGMSPESLQRQMLAFGESLNTDLRQLRVGIVGCGATGSATGLLLARLGVQKLFIVDRDYVEATNLNRLHGATSADVEAKTPKTQVLKRQLEDMGLGINVVLHDGWIGDEACRDPLRSCDVVFGCTDDNDGRMLLNRFAYYYLTPVIDMGIGIDVSQDSPPRVLDAAGRTTVVVPGSRCLLCRKAIDHQLAREEHLKRVNPAEYLARREQQYVHGDPGPTPAVVTFTTSVACMAVDELVHRLTGYRRADPCSHRVRKFHLLEDKRPGIADGRTCSLCVTPDAWGRGDIEPFLDRVG